MGNIYIFAGFSAHINSAANSAIGYGLIIGTLVRPPRNLVRRQSTWLICPFCCSMHNLVWFVVLASKIFSSILQALPACSSETV